MKEIEPIRVGQRFTSNGNPGTVIFVDQFDPSDSAVVWRSDAKLLRCFSIFGGGDKHFSRVDDLQPIPDAPVTIQEGVEFSGPEYASEFARLVKDGREFEWAEPVCRRWVKFTGEFCSTGRYLLVPQCLDANGRVLNVGDRVQHLDGRRFKIVKVEASKVMTGNFFEASDQYKLLKTVTRPLCKKDLADAQSPAFINSFGSICWPNFAGDHEVSFGYIQMNYDKLVEKGWKWRPRYDEWRSCEITEEVLA